MGGNEETYSKRADLVKIDGAKEDCVSDMFGIALNVSFCGACTGRVGQHSPLLNAQRLSYFLNSLGTGGVIWLPRIDLR